MNGILLKETKVGGILRVAFKLKDNEILFIIKDYAEIKEHAMELNCWNDFVIAVNRANNVFHMEQEKANMRNMFDEKKWFKEYYQKNKEKIAEIKAKYYQENKERIKKRNIQWGKDNPEKVKRYRRESSRRYYEKYPEKVKAATKRWLEAHPEYRRQWREKNKAKVNEYSKEWERQKRKKLAIMSYQK